MANCKCEDIKRLQKKLDQHEQLITQLVEVIAATNQRLINLVEQKKEAQKIYTAI